MAVSLLTDDTTAGTALSKMHGSMSGGLIARINEIITLANANETALAGASNPLNFAGTIAAAADFPTLAVVDTGDVYRITAAVIDNDATKTNTSQEFLAGTEIAWNGTNWTELGRAGAAQVEGSATINVKTLGANAVALNGLSANQFIPKELVFVCATATALNGDLAVSVGTTPGGTELMAATTLTGLNTANEKFVIPMAGLMPAIAGNASLDITVTSADTGTSGTVTAYIRGEEL